MNRTVALILNPIVRVLEVKEPAVVGGLVSLLALLGGYFGLHLSPTQTITETAIVNGIVTIAVRQLVTATGVAPLDQDDTALTSGPTIVHNHISSGGGGGGGAIELRSAHRAALKRR